MKKYVNGVSDLKFAAIFSNFIFSSAIILRLVSYKSNEKIYDLIIMVIGLLVCIFALDFTIFFLRKQAYTTYFNEEAIEQRFFMSKKRILLKDIKHILVIKNTIILSNDIINIDILPTSISKILYRLSSNIIILLGKSDSILILLSCLDNVKLDVMHLTKNVEYRITKYFSK